MLDQDGYSSHGLSSLVREGKDEIGQPVNDHGHRIVLKKKALPHDDARQGKLVHREIRGKKTNPPGGGRIST